MPVLVFDTSPLSAFARVERLDVLATRFGESARWTVEVREEIRRGVGGHPTLADVVSAPWLGDPIRLTDPADLTALERIRWALGGTDARPDRHRGEAATIVAAEQLGAVAVLDDRDARALTAARGVALVGTEGILRACGRDNQLTWDDAWAIFTEMRGIGVRLRDLTREQFESG